jgi:GT2 family glycosyltransferase
MIFKLRSIFLKPDSKLELWLRTQYHRLNQTRFFFKFHDWLAKRSYNRWRKNQDNQPLSDPNTFEFQPKVSFLISQSSESNQDLIHTIESIRNLQGDNWEIFLVSGQENNQTSQKQQLLIDDRISNIDSAPLKLTNSINGEFTIFCEAGDQFLKGLLVHFYNSLLLKNSADWYYYDCEYVDKETKKITPLFKPQSLSPALLLSVNYLSRGFIRTSFIKEFLQKENNHHNLLYEEYGLALKLCETTAFAVHIPKILIKQTKLVESNIDQIQKRIIGHLSRSGLEDISSEVNSIGTQFTWQTKMPSVAIIIPTKNNKKLLSNCLSSLKNKTNYENYNIHIIDNNSDDPETRNYYQKLKSEPRIKIHPYLAEFNYSQAVNLGVAQSESDLVLLLNDDMETINQDWLTELVQWAIRPGIGVVGGKLIRDNHTIQHAGIIIGLNGFAGHIYLNAPEHYQGLFGSVDWYRDYQALTGACQMIRRKVFNEVSGYDEDYKIAFGDIDFCLRVHQAGYRNIYTPFATLFHYEGRSRGYITPLRDVLRGYTKMRDALTQEDPFFSPNLSYSRIPKCVLKEQTSEEREKIIEIRKRFHEKN